MNVLLTAFQGTSAERLIRQFDSRYDKVILCNSKPRSVEQLTHALALREYRFIISFGQKPVIKEKVYLELCAKLDGTVLQTLFPVFRLAEALTANGIAIKFSYNAGTSFCNHLYACGLRHLAQNAANSEMVFIHIPFQKNISYFDSFSRKLRTAIDQYLLAES